MCTRSSRLFPRSTASVTLLSTPFRPLLPRTNTIRRRWLRRIQRILPQLLLQNCNPRHQQLNQRRLLNTQTLKVLSAQTINHKPIKPDHARTVADPPEQLQNLLSVTGWVCSPDQYLALVKEHHCSALQPVRSSATFQTCQPMRDHWQPDWCAPTRDGQWSPTRSSSRPGFAVTIRV